MSKRSRDAKEIVMTWICPHCGAEHYPGGIIRLDGDTFQCKQCKRGFPAIAPRTTRKIGCLDEIPERHGCGGRLHKRGLAIVGTREFLTLYCNKCFGIVKFKGPHVRAHEAL